MSTAITLEHVPNTCGPVKALDDFSLEIPSGVVFGLLGPNGAGKTTAMRICSTLLAVLLAAVALVGVAYAAPDGERTLTPDEALTRAIVIMGLDKDTTWQRPATSEAVTTLTITDDDTPFLHDKINGRSALKVTLDSVPVVARNLNTDSVVMKGFRDFDVYLDLVSGQLLRIVSALESYEGKVKSGEIRFPPPAVAEEQLGSERYLSLSTITPSAGFLTALEHAFGNPIGSDLIVAQLLEVQKSGRHYSAAWIVNTHGVVSFSPHGRHQKRDIPLYQRRHARTVLDTAGQYLYSTNVPYATH